MLESEDGKKMHNFTQLNGSVKLKMQVHSLQIKLCGYERAESPAGSKSVCLERVSNVEQAYGKQWIILMGKLQDI